MKKGTTTKLVDRYIQELFTKGITYIYEGRHSEKAIELTERCFYIFKNRMILEHENIGYSFEYLLIDGIWCYKVKLSQ